MIVCVGAISLLESVSGLSSALGAGDGVVSNPPTAVSNESFEASVAGVNTPVEEVWGANPEGTKLVETSSTLAG